MRWVTRSSPAPFYGRWALIGPEPTQASSPLATFFARFRAVFLVADFFAVVWLLAAFVLVVRALLAAADLRATFFAAAFLTAFLVAVVFGVAFGAAFFGAAASVCAVASGGLAGVKSELAAVLVFRRPLVLARCCLRLAAFSL